MNGNKSGSNPGLLRHIQVGTANIPSCLRQSSGDKILWRNAGGNQENLAEDSEQQTTNFCQCPAVPCHRHGSQ
ncbi:MAG TPA: hypothetical protein H9684_03580 [Firmicutes bacterium]|nr:hypothetical protein [Bacillota bacterium]